MTEDPQTRVITAKTVDEAIEVAMHELDAARDEVEVEVLSRGKVGFLGIGSGKRKDPRTQALRPGG